MYTFQSSCAHIPAVVHVSQQLCTFHKPPNNVRGRPNTFSRSIHINPYLSFGALEVQVVCSMENCDVSPSTLTGCARGPVHHGAPKIPWVHGCSPFYKGVFQGFSPWLTHFMMEMYGFCMDFVWILWTISIQSLLRWGCRPALCPKPIRLLASSNTMVPFHVKMAGK